MINIPIDSSLKSESIDISYTILIKKKLKKCGADSEFSGLKKFMFRVILIMKTLNILLNILG